MSKGFTDLAVALEDHVALPRLHDMLAVVGPSASFQAGADGRKLNSRSTAMQQFERSRWQYVDAVMSVHAQGLYSNGVIGVDLKV